MLTALFVIMPTHYLAMKTFDTNQIYLRSIPKGWQRFKKIVDQLKPDKSFSKPERAVVAEWVSMSIKKKKKKKSFSKPFLFCFHLHIWLNFVQSTEIEQRTG